MNLQKNIDITLFKCISEIINTVKQDIIKTVNVNMVIAYWLIGREIVLSIQDGSERAEYGKESLRDLSNRLNAQFGSGFSETNLRYFRTFYMVFLKQRNSAPTGR